MRKSRRLSPSALAKFEKDRENYYLSYCAENRPKREPQSRPASVGSSFDAYVKSALMSDVLGIKDQDTILFESQVEEHNRDFAYEAGAVVMDSYVQSGAYKDLLDMLEGALEEPQFEFDADTSVNGIPIAGKPDCRFIHRGGAHIILDWKVNGYCGKNATSPSKGFALCRDGRGWDKPSRSNGTSHKLFEPVEFMGLTVNKFFMEQVSIDWADQLAMYGWMMGEEVGSEEVVVCIDQIVAKPGDKFPLLRVANHRNRVSAAHQHGLLSRLTAMWNAIQNGQIFEEDNEAKCAELDTRALSMISDGTEQGDFFAKCARNTSFYRGR